MQTPRWSWPITSRRMGTCPLSDKAIMTPLWIFNHDDIKWGWLFISEEVEHILLHQNLHIWGHNLTPCVFPTFLLRDEFFALVLVMWFYLLVLTHTHVLSLHLSTKKDMITCTHVSTCAQCSAVLSKNARTHAHMHAHDIGPKDLRLMCHEQDVSWGLFHGWCWWRDSWHCEEEGKEPVD